MIGFRHYKSSARKVKFQWLFGVRRYGFSSVLCATVMTHRRLWSYLYPIIRRLWCIIKGGRRNKFRGGGLKKKQLLLLGFFLRRIHSSFKITYPIILGEQGTPRPCTTQCIIMCFVRIYVFSRSESLVDAFELISYWEVIFDLICHFLNRLCVPVRYINASDWTRWGTSLQTRYQRL